MEKKSATNCIIVPPTVLAKLHINTAAAIKNIDTESKNEIDDENNQRKSSYEEKMVLWKEDGNTQLKRKLSSDSVTDTANNRDDQLIKSNEDDDRILPKKRGRGRPKKNFSENTSKQEDPPVLDKPPLATSSQRGRKVKRLNYSFIENANPTGDNEKIDSEKESNDAKPNKRGRGRARKSILETKNIDKPIKELDTLSAKNCNINDQELSKALDSETDNNENKMQCIEDSKEDCDDVDKNKQGSSRYNYTGNSRRALNQMFNALQAKEGDENDQKPVVVSTRRRGRKKLIQNLNAKSCICMNCNQTMAISEWLEHNSNQHYNLAWIQGELPLPVNDEAFVVKILTKLKKSKGILKCNKCGVEMKKAQLFYDHLDICNGIVTVGGQVTCAVCKTTMQKAAWSYHRYRQHNNLAWREGDPPLNLDDQDLVIRILQALYKSKKPLHCEKCDTIKKSVFGYLSHKTICQKSTDELEEVKVPCDICGKKVLPVSMDCHLKSHTKIEPESLSASNYFDSSMEISGRRKAAKHALEIISGLKDETREEMKYYTDKCDFKETFIEEYLQNQLSNNQKVSCIFLECDVSIDSIEGILDHISSCDKKPKEYYICKLCLFLCGVETDMLMHLKQQHNKTFKIDANFKVGTEQICSDDEELECDGKEKKLIRLRSKQKMSMNAMARVKPEFLIYPMREESSALLYRQAYVWMKEFCEEHYSNTNIHQFLRNKKSWRLLDSDLIMEYLPKEQISCDVAARILNPNVKNDEGENLNWEKMELFEVRDFYEGDKTIFCGGSITGLSWLPTPYNKNKLDQILAVSVLNHRDAKYQVDKNSNEPCLIQFWNFGQLNESESVKPFLMSCIALNIGPIWHTEWCPSGCFDEESDELRMGLLAVAGSDSFVYIYCVNRVPEHDRGLIYKAEPVIRLQLNIDNDSLGKQPYYACKISWCKASGHRYIAVGYSMGVAAIFDLNTESDFLKMQNNNGEVTIFPYLSFQAHYSSITVISLNHLNGGNRWLCTGSFDRMVSYWDLYRKIKINTIKRTVATDGLWTTLWPCAIISEDETTMANTITTHTYFKPLREAMTETRNLTSASSSLKALSYSDWLNAVLHCSSAGEIVAQFNHRLFFNVNSKLTKASYTKCLFTKTELVPKIDGATKEYRTYKEAVNEFGLVFLDYQLDKLANCPNTKKKNADDFSYSSPTINEYCLQSINRVQFNPNVQSCKYYVAGYHSGFVRLQYLKFLSPLES